MFAVRNPNLCSKECLCLFVCPTGATATENGTIDATKCIDGCRLCVDACPEHAIYLVPSSFPETPVPDAPLLAKIVAVLQARADLRTRLVSLQQQTKDEVWSRVLAALQLSSKILGEDCVRASGMLTPQPKALAALASESALQNTANGDNAVAPDMVLELILAALAGKRDADQMELAVCAACGAIYCDPIPKTCACCESTNVEAIP